MIGYYVHHQGSGHVHRALALAAELEERLGEEVVGLSSLPRPTGWRGEWLVLDRDDRGGDAEDPTAAERLHWAPLHDAGLRRRTAQLSRWLEQARPQRVVVDVSVEVALLARLHGVPVVGVVLPGRRADAAHRLGQDVAEHLVGFWPPSATRGLLPGLAEDVVRRVCAVGALSRFPVAEPGPRRPGRRRVVVMSGTGGAGLTLDASDVGANWQCTVLGGRGGWCDDPRPLIADADVVVTHAGQNALAEVAAARRPALIVPQPRPHDEQHVTADVLASGPWPALVEQGRARERWADRLSSAAALDGGEWDEWCDGGAARRFVEVVGG